MMLTGNTYDRLKFFTLILLPAISAAYFTLAQIWGLPAAEQVVGSIAVLSTFLGATLRISANNYEAAQGSQLVGEFVVTDTPEGKRWSLELNKDPELFETADEVRFRMKR